MAFEKGRTKTGGRTKGSQNKSRKLVRDIVEGALNGKTIPERLLELTNGNPDREIDVLTDLLPYCYPKLQAVDITSVPDGGESSDESKVFFEILKKVIGTPA